MDVIYNYTSDIVLGGDFNINYNLRHTDSFQMLKELERDYILTQIINEDTRITSKSSTRLDLIFTNCADITESGTNLESASYTTIKARTFQNYIKEDFQQDIKNDPIWENVWKLSNVNEVWDLFEIIISNQADKHCPVKEIRVRNDSPHWFSRELLEEICQRDRLYKKAKMSKVENDWTVFKEKRKEVKNMLIQAKEEFIKGKLEEEKLDPNFFCVV